MSDAPMHERTARVLEESRLARGIARLLDATQAGLAAQWVARGYVPDASTGLSIIKRFDPRSEDRLPYRRLMWSIVRRRPVLAAGGTARPATKDPAETVSVTPERSPMNESTDEGGRRR